MIKFWTWYDNMKEPKRFFFAIFILCSPILVGNFFIQTKYQPLEIGLIIFQMFIIISRMRYQFKKSKK